MKIDVLFICTGNTCRSVMAEYFLKQLHPHLQVASAGFKNQSIPANPKTINAMKKFRLDVSKHISRPIDQKMLENAKSIIVMERKQIHKLGKFVHKAVWLSAIIGKDFDILNPYGKSQREYYRVAETIQRILRDMKLSAL